MRPYRHHVFVCEGKRCGDKNSKEVLNEFRQMARQSGIDGVKITRCGCMSVCKETSEAGELSPAVVVYPEGLWYKNVGVEDVAEIFEGHLEKGTPVERLLLDKPSED